MKPTIPHRTRKRSFFLMLGLPIIVITLFGFSKVIHHTPEMDLSSAKHYTAKGICPGIGISNAKLKTKLADGKALYLLHLTVTKGKKRKLPRLFTIKLVDKDGFDVKDFTINSTSLTEELDASENLVGYSYQSAQFMDADAYRLVAGWDLIWAFN